MGLGSVRFVTKPTVQKKVVFALLVVISMYPVRCRPSSTFPDGSPSPEPQLSQVLNDEPEQVATAIGEREFNEDNYPQNDAPMENNESRNRHVRPHHLKDNSRRIISEQMTSPLRPVSEANDTLPGLVHEFNAEDFNNTFIGDQGDNSSLTDENVIRLSKNNRER
ncbi:hypothetical protein C0J52_21337 [Blattella germanica]|nr:hypothetical protein C0J52_21337 [Blattella germanica]